MGEKAKKRSQVQGQHAPGIRSVVESLSSIHSALYSICTTENKWVLVFSSNLYWHILRYVLRPWNTGRSIALSSLEHNPVCQKFYLTWTLTSIDILHKISDVFCTDSNFMPLEVHMGNSVNGVFKIKWITSSYSLKLYDKGICITLGKYHVA